MDLVVFIRTDGVVAQRYAPSDLAAEGGSVKVTAETPIAVRENGPFAPLAQAITKDGTLRDVMAKELAIPSLRHHARLRLVALASTALPMVMLLELDREIVMGGHATPARLFVDLLLVATVVFELTRRTPRFPGIAAMALVAIALRWTLVASRLCGRDVHALVYLGAALPMIAAIVIAVRFPSRARVALELLGKVGVTRSELFAATSPTQPPPALVAAAVACAAGLPALLHLVRMVSANIWIQAFVFVTFGFGAPWAARKFLEPEAPVPTAKKNIEPLTIMLAVASGLALTAAAVTSGRLFFDTGVELARCLSRLDNEAKMARAAESAELAHAIAKVRASAPLVILTSAVFPFAEERIYRGLLQDTLVRRYGVSYGMFAAAVAFGVAHLGIYQVALYQTVLLGIGFGLAYAEGGLLAAFIVHATWNLLQLG